MTGLIYILNIFCTSGQSVLTKQYSKRGGATEFNFNKATAGSILFLILALISGFSFHLPTLLFGAAYGVSLCISMHAGFRALAIGPMALSSIIASFSLVIPFLFGIIFWSEAVTVFKIVGIVLLLCSIALINGKKESGFSVKWLVYVLIVLFADGICSVIQKMHQMSYPGLYQTEFVFFANVLAVLVWFALTNINAKSPGIHAPKITVLGLLGGVLNCLANYTVLYLAAGENASVLFPIVSIANIMVVWVVGIVFFKEKTKPLQTIGLIVGVISVVLLKI